MQSSQVSRQIVEKSNRADQLVRTFRQSYERSLEHVKAIVLVVNQENNIYALASRSSPSSESHERTLVRLSEKRDDQLNGIRSELLQMEQCADELRNMQTDTNLFLEDAQTHYSLNPQKAFENISDSANTFTDGLLRCREIFEQYTDPEPDSKMTEQEFQQEWETAIQGYEEQNQKVDDALAELLGAMSSSSSMPPPTPANSYVEQSKLLSYQPQQQQHAMPPTIPDLDDEEMIS